MKTKAAVLYEINKPLIIEEIEIPKLRRGQVLVKVLYSGICRSQLNEIKGHKGPDKYLPHLLGHEGSGIVKEVGPEVTKVKKGDYVVLTWITGKGINAGGCVYKKGNLDINSGPITTFNEYSIISENKLVKISKEVPPDIGALLGCAIPTGAGIIKNQIEIKKGKTLAIFGIGGIGANALLFASTQEFKKIIAIDINEEKLNFAKKVGADFTINSNNENTLKKIMSITNNNGLDYAIECTGVKSVMEQLLDTLNWNGKAVIAGNLIKGEKIAIDPFTLIRGKRIVGTWGGNTNPEEDIPYYIDLIIEKVLKIDNLISNIYSFDNINEVIEDLKKKNKIIRAIIKF